MGKASRLHKERVIAGLEKPFRPVVIPEPQYLRCGKCFHSMPEYAVNEHLKKCQPAGAKCGKCGVMIPATGFIEHFKECGKPAIIPDDLASKTAMPFPPPPPGPLSGGRQPIGIEPSGKLIFKD